MNKLHQIASACAATAMLAATVPAFAQSSTTPGNTQATDRAYTTDTRKEDNNWSWLGLLGLVGLMGLKGRANHDDNHRRTTTNIPGRA